MEVELEPNSTVVETKTAIEWENERSEDEGSQTTTTTTASSDACQPILCFDAYGNLTSQKASIPDSGLSLHLDPFSSYLDLSSSYQLSSSEEDDGLDEAFSYSSVNIGSKKKSKPKTKIRFSDNQLKQVIKEEVQEVVTTSRYGRERKKRTSDGFLFGTINFNELRRVTASAITVPAAKRDKNDECDLNRISFDCLSNSINELGPPGDAPPDKILASCESSSETEDVDCKPSSTSEKTPKLRRKKTSRQKNILLSENTVQPDEGCAQSPMHKKTRKRKSIEDKSGCSTLPGSVFADDLTSQCLRSEVSSTSNDDNVPPHTNKRAKFVDSSKKNDCSSISLKKQAESSSEQLKEYKVKARDQKVTRKERATHHKRHIRVTSDDEGEANFTPRKKKRKPPIMCLDLPEQQDDLVNNSVLQSYCYDSRTVERINASSPFNSNGVINADGCPEVKPLRQPFDFGTVGDIADDLRLLKDLTDKSQSVILPCMSSTTVKVEPREVPQSVGICSVTSTSTPRKKKPPIAISSSKHHRKQTKNRGRPSKILSSKGSMKSSLHLRDRKPNFKRSSGHARPSIKVEPAAKEMVVEDKEEEEEVDISVDHDCNARVSKRGRRIKKPDLTDISILHQKEVEARLQLRDAAVAAASSTAQQESGSLLKDQLADYEAQNPPQHMEGDLVWVALRGYPVWPAVVVLHPVEQLTTRIEVKQSSVARLYHLHFLNDNQRQHWMRQEYVLPFEGRQAMMDGLLKTKEEFMRLPPSDRNFQALLLKSLPSLLLDPTRHVAGSKLFKWNAAVMEADLSLLNTRGDRIIKYSKRSTTKVEATVATAVTASTVVKKKKKKKEKNLASAACLSESVTLKQEPAEVIPSVSRSQSPTLYMLADSDVKTTHRDRRSPSNESEFSGFEDSSASEMNKKRKLEVIENLSKQDAFELFYKVRLAAFSKANPGCNESLMKEMLRGKWVKLTYDERVKFCERHLDSQDESDDAGGKSGKSSSNDELDNQSEVSDVSAASSSQYKKNYKKEGFDTTRATYRLPRNEKVCHKCESVSVEPNGADMIRCKGLCCGSFHLSCAGLQSKPENDKEFKCKECETGMHPCFICKSVSGVAGKSNKKEGRTKQIKGEKCLAKNKDTVGKTDGNSESVSSITETKSVSKPEDKPDKKFAGENTDVPETVDGCFTIKKSDEATNETKSCTLGSRRSIRLTSADTSDEVESNSAKVKVEAVEGTTDMKSGVIDTKYDLPVNEDTKVEGIELAELTGPGERDMPSVFGKETGDALSCRQVQRCTVPYCGKFYHLECALKWPQVSHTWQEGKKLVCPRHMCHMCAASAEDMNCAIAKSGPMTRCLRCPTTYHTGGECIAAGSEEISSSFHVCPKHNSQAKSNHLNVTWCFGCSKGGSLVLCDECPAAFHLECLDASPPAGGGFVCEDCVNGKLPVYGDIVWAKLGSYRWWPGKVLHPRFIPDNIEKLKHTQGMFCVHFFGSNDYYWVHRGRVFHYQEGDRGCKTYQKNTLNRHFEKALEETKKAFEAEQTNKAIREAKRHEKGSSKPPPFVRIDTNRPVGNVKRQELELPPRCDCDLNGDAPCGLNTNCINRMLMIECAVDVCGAGDRCCNQRFQRRQYPNLAPAKVEGRGWGLKALQDIRAGDFVIEYVGELVDEAELWRRIDYMHHISEGNYYFLTITKDIIIDAGPKGNLARFMNHSCDPNCETQKWQVGTETRVGLFALQDIPAGSEVTFNYNFECVGTEKKKCHCGSELCSGYIGAKVPKAEPLKKSLLALGKKKRRKKKAPPVKATEDDCFRCGLPGDLLLCDVASCPKGYHLNCLGLTSLPKGKWLCPWHHCDECGSRANSRCELCPSSFCRSHSAGKIIYSATVRGGAAADAVGTQSVTGVQGGISYCCEHTELAVSQFLANTRTTLRVQTDAVRAESLLPQAQSAVAAAPAAVAALHPLSHRAATPSRRISLERSQRANARSHIRELYNLSEQCNEDESMDWSVLQALSEESALLPAEDEEEDDGVTIGQRARALSSGSSSEDDGRHYGATQITECHAKDSTLTQCSKDAKFVTIAGRAAIPAPAVINVVVRKRSNAARGGKVGTRIGGETRVEDTVRVRSPNEEGKRSDEVQGKESAPSEGGREDKDGDAGTGTVGSAIECVLTDKVDHTFEASPGRNEDSLVMPPPGLGDVASESLKSASPCSDVSLEHNKWQDGRSKGMGRKNKINGKDRKGPFGRKLKRNIKRRGSSSSVTVSNKTAQSKGAQKKPNLIAPVSADEFGQNKEEREKANPDLAAPVGNHKGRNHKGKQQQKRDLTAPLSSIIKKKMRQSKMDDFVDECLTPSRQDKNSVRSLRNTHNTLRNVAVSGVQKSLKCARSPLLRNRQRVNNNNVRMPGPAKKGSVVGSVVGGTAGDENSATDHKVVALGALLPQGVNGSFVEGVPTSVKGNSVEGPEVLMKRYQQLYNGSNDGDDDDIAVVFEQPAPIGRTTCKCCRKAFSPTGTICNPGLAAIRKVCRPLASAVGGCRPHNPAGGGCRPPTPGRGRGYCGDIIHHFSLGCGASACKAGGACRSVQSGTGNSSSVNDVIALKNPSPPAGIPKKCCPVHSPAPRPLTDHGNTCHSNLARAGALSCCRGGATGCGRGIAGGPVARPFGAGHHGHQAHHHCLRGAWPHRVQSVVYESGHRQAPRSLPDPAPQNGPIVKTGGLHVDMPPSHPRARRTITSTSLPNGNGGQDENGVTSDEDDDILPLTVPTITIEV